MFTPNTEKCLDPLCNVRPARWYVAGYCSRACFEVAIRKALEQHTPPAFPSESARGLAQ